MSSINHANLEFRAMQESDLPDVMDIEKEGHIFPWTDGIFKDCIKVGYYCPLLICEQKILGYGVMSIAAGEAHIFNVCISQTFRQQGLGRKLVLHLLDVASQIKVSTVFLEVRPSNTVAVNLYDQLGFIEAGIRKNYYPAINNKREDAVIMAMELGEF